MSTATDSVKTGRQTINANPTPRQRLCLMCSRVLHGSKPDRPAAEPQTHASGQLLLLPQPDPNRSNATRHRDLISHWLNVEQHLATVTVPVGELGFTWVKQLCSPMGTPRQPSVFFCHVGVKAHVYKFTGVTVDFLSKRSAVTRRDATCFLNPPRRTFIHQGKHLSKVTKWKLYVFVLAFLKYSNDYSCFGNCTSRRWQPCWFSRLITSCVIRRWNAFQRLSQWPLRKSGSDGRRVNNDQISFLFFFIIIFFQNVDVFI